VIEEDAAGVRQAELSRRALQEARVEPLLELGDLAADRRLRDAERLRRRDEAAGLHDPREDEDLVEVHGSSSHW